MRYIYVDTHVHLNIYTFASPYGHAPTKSARPRKDCNSRQREETEEGNDGEEKGDQGDSGAKAAQIISHHLSVKIRILNKRATQNYHGPGIKAASQTRDHRPERLETRETKKTVDRNL